MILLILAVSTFLISLWFMIDCVFKKGCYDSLMFFSCCAGLGASFGVILSMAVKEYIKTI